MNTEESATPTSPAESVESVESRLQARLFGEDTATAPQPDAEQPEQQDEDPSDTQDAEPEEEQQAEASTDDQESEEQATLAAHLGLEDDQLIEGEDGKVYVNAKINGEVQKVDFQDLVKGYQTEKAVTQKSQALAEQRKEFEAQATQAQQVYTDKIKRADEALQIIEKNLVSGFESVDWDKLRQENPAEWAAKRQEMAQQYQKINSTREQIQQEQQRLTQAQQAQQAQQEQARLAQESDKMLASNPAWQDPDVKKRELSEIRGFLAESYGFNDEDLQHVTDHRLVSLIQDAHRYRQMQSQSAPKIKKPVPKYLKPGAQKPSASSTAKKAAREKRASLKKSGSISDAAAILFDRM